MGLLEDVLNQQDQRNQQSVLPPQLNAADLMRALAPQQAQNSAPMPQSPDQPGADSSGPVSHTASWTDPRNPGVPGAPPIAQISSSSSKGPGLLRRTLGNFLYYGGQGMLKSSGMPTDLDVANLQSQMDARKAQTIDTMAQSRQRNAQTDQMGQMVTLPNGATMPYGLALKAFPAYFSAQGRVDVQGLKNEGALDVQGLKNQAAVTPERKLGQAYVDALDKGDTEGATKALADLKNLKAASGTAKSPNEISLVIAAQRGDAEAQKTLDTLQQRKIQLGTTTAVARGKAFGYYRYQNYYDPEVGQNVPMPQGEAQAAIANGKKLIPSGPLGANTLLAFQRLNSEASPAIEGMRKNIGAFDNAGDRAIFARILKDNPMAEGGDPLSWMGNIINQAGKANLSPQGQQLVVNQARLGETLNLLRSTVGAPATNSAISLAMKLLPGGTTPDSAFAGKQLDELEQIVKQSNVSMLGGSANKSEGGATTPKVGTIDSGYLFKGGDPRNRANWIKVGR